MDVRLRDKGGPVEEGKYLSGTRGVQSMVGGFASRSVSRTRDRPSDSTKSREDNKFMQNRQDQI